MVRFDQAFVFSAGCAQRHRAVGLKSALRWPCIVCVIQIALRLCCWHLSMISRMALLHHRKEVCVCSGLASIAPEIHCNLISCPPCPCRQAQRRCLRHSSSCKTHNIARATQRPTPGKILSSPVPRFLAPLSHPTHVHGQVLRDRRQQVMRQVSDRGSHLRALGGGLCRSRCCGDPMCLGSFRNQPFGR